jgi:hypothetical protein
VFNENCETPVKDDPGVAKKAVVPYGIGVADAGVWNADTAISCAVFGLRFSA